MREGHHSQANGPSTCQSTKLDWQVLGPLAELYAMSGRQLSGLEIKLSGVGGPCPENHALEPYAWHVSEGPRWLERTFALTGRSAQLIRYANANL
jgi:hypothetical protein